MSEPATDDLILIYHDRDLPVNVEGFTSLEEARNFEKMVAATHEITGVYRKVPCQHQRADFLDVRTPCDDASR
jgi:hypothetical protein